MNKARKRIILIRKRPYCELERGNRRLSGHIAWLHLSTMGLRLRSEMCCYRAESLPWGLRPTQRG